MSTVKSKNSEFYSNNTSINSYDNPRKVDFPTLIITLIINFSVMSLCRNSRSTQSVQIRISSTSLLDIHLAQNVERQIKRLPNYVRLNLRVLGRSELVKMNPDELSRSSLWERSSGRSLPGCSVSGVAAGTLSHAEPVMHVDIEGLRLEFSMFEKVGQEILRIRWARMLRPRTVIGTSICVIKK